MLIKGFRKSFLYFFALFLVLIEPAAASVVMMNTRVVYPAGAQSQTVQFTNNDTIPYVMQIWTDINNEQSTPENSDGPFIVVPAMFRIEPKTGQSVRLMFTGKNLPQDRESLFYLNAVQIPPKNAAGNVQNQMLIVLRNRVKVFYRPMNLAGRPDQIGEKLRFTLQQQSGQWILKAYNDSNYYASVIGAAAVMGKQEIPFKTDMIAPKSQASWPLSKRTQSPVGAQKIKFTLVNDYGGYTEAEVSLSH